MFGKVDGGEWNYKKGGTARKQETGSRYRLSRVKPSALEQFLLPVSCFLAVPAFL
jgi:hypothetical protein